MSKCDVCLNKFEPLYNCTECDNKLCLTCLHLVGDDNRILCPKCYNKRNQIDENKLMGEK